MLFHSFFDSCGLHFFTTSLLLLLLFSEETPSSDLIYTFLLPLILPRFFTDLKESSHLQSPLGNQFNGPLIHTFRPMYTNKQIINAVAISVVDMYRMVKKVWRIHKETGKSKFRRLEDAKIYEICRWRE